MSHHQKVANRFEMESSLQDQKLKNRSIQCWTWVALQKAAVRDGNVTHEMLTHKQDMVWNGKRNGTEISVWNIEDARMEWKISRME